MVHTEQIEVSVKGYCDIVDITGSMIEAVINSGINSGTITAFCPGSTGAITTIEYEPGLIADIKLLFERIIPQGINYNHNLRWGDGNGHAHVRASILGASTTIPFTEKSLMVGTWQQIILIDFDNRPRSRQVILQLVGD